MRRRDLIIGGMGAAAFARTAAARADGGARRVFRIVRGGSDIGRHTLDARVNANGDFEVAIEIDIEVRVVVGLVSAYSYRMSNREVWRDRRIVSVDSETDDDGTEEFCRIRRGDGALRVEGTAFTGTQPLSAVTTTYYAPEFVERRPWISSQSGKPLSVAADPVSGEPRTWRITGDISVETVLGYNDRGEWDVCRFDARGETVRYEVIEDTGNIAELWRGAGA